jgi:spore coat polysaccharide biosynthesis protein SpsF
MANLRTSNTPCHTKRGRGAVLLLARLDSTRLPGKGLLNLGENGQTGPTVLKLALDRLRQCRTVHQVILTTTDRAIDQPLVDFADEQGIACYRGDIHDVTGRCLGAMEAHDLNWSMRISGDSPFICPDLCDGVNQLYTGLSNCDLATNVSPRTYPFGASAESFSFQALRTIWQSANKSEKEHVTLYAYNKRRQFTICNHRAANHLHDLYNNCRVGVDTQDDLARSQWIMTQLDNPIRASLEDIAILSKTWEKSPHTKGQG